MRTLIARAIPLAVSLVLVGCASKPLPKYEKPLARASVMSVRTTAYTHTEADHVQYSDHNALGGHLQYGPINSAAADWSRWPAGSVFRIRETGEIFQVDDYGWALAGTNTIDLYKSSRVGMNQWGVRRVTIENLRWGDPRQSLSILRPRSRYAHIKRMINQLEERMPEWISTGFSPQVASADSSPAPVAIAPAVAVAQPIPAATRPHVSSLSPSSPAIQPFNSVAMTQPAPAPRNSPATRTNGATATREAFLNSFR
jgi:3D (Asp-Asp-Asp) domain-containing protein